VVPVDSARVEGVYVEKKTPVEVILAEVPVPKDKVTVIVLLAYGAVGWTGYEGQTSVPDDDVPVDSGGLEGVYVETGQLVAVPSVYVSVEGYELRKCQ
jgi:hypothetical protein